MYLGRGADLTAGFNLTWCVVPSISTGTMKSALLIGCRRQDSEHILSEQQGIHILHMHAYLLTTQAAETDRL